jgi:hypothetical protein
MEKMAIDASIHEMVHILHDYPTIKYVLFASSDNPGEEHLIGASIFKPSDEVRQYISKALEEKPFNPSFVPNSMRYIAQKRALLDSKSVQLDVAIRSMRMVKNVLNNWNTRDEDSYFALSSSFIALQAQLSLSQDDIPISEWR